MADIEPKALDGMTLQLVAIPLKGNPGEQGKGTKGDTGKSNYQLWLEAGNVGNIDVFLAAMKGEPGEDGKGLINRGNWQPGFYNPNDYVFDTNVDENTAMFIALGSEEFLSETLPKDDPDNWVEFSSPKGTPGEDGTDGTDGTDGVDGKDGSIWFIDNGAPDAGIGKVGDCYLDIDTGDVYQKTGSGWGSPIGTLDGGGSGPTTPTYPTVTAVPGASTTAALTDANHYNRFTFAGAKTLTFDGNTAYVLSSEFHGRNVSSGNLTLAVANGFVLNAPAGGSLVVPQGGTFTIKIVGAKEADVIGYTVAS